MARKLLLVTDRKFWLQDTGSCKRVAHLYQFVLTLPLVTTVLYLGDLNSQDCEVIQQRYPHIELFIPPITIPIFESPKKTNSKKVFLRNFFTALNLARFAKKVRAIRAELGFLANNQNDDSDPIKTESRLKDFFRLDFQDYFDRVFQELNPDFVLVEYIRLAYVVDRLSPEERSRTHLMIDTLDVMYQRCQSFKDNGMPHWVSITKAEESQVLSNFDTVIAIQPKDADKLKNMLPDKRVIIAEHSSTTKRLLDLRNNTLTISYIASSGDVNKTSIVKFINDVWLRLVDRFGNKIYLNIVGGVCSSLKNLEPIVNASLIGYVDDLETIYRQTDIVINPVLFGGGLKIKNVEALSYGKPLVTTSAGAEGLDSGSNVAFLVCDTSEEFYKALCHLIENRDYRDELSENAFDFSRRRFQPEIAYRELAAVLLDA